METVLKAIADWIKGILTAGIMSNLSGLFDDVNTQVGNIAQQVGTKPSAFEPRVFAMIEALSRNVVLPIAGIILTFIACYELIEMITQHNNMAQFEPALIMRWIFKTAVSVWLISNTFDIVMAVFDITQKVVSDSSGIIAGNTRVNDIGLSMLQCTMKEKRDETIILRLSKTEKNRIYEKMLSMGIRSLSAYIRKMALDGYCLNLDLPQLRRMAYLLQMCSNNLNQYAKAANENGRVYAADMEDLRQRLDELIEIGRQILSRLADL